MTGPALEYLNVRADGVYVDGTVGLAGHSALIAGKLTSGRLYAFDRDPDALAIARERLAPFPGAVVRHGNYAHLRRLLEAEGVESVDGILIDAGVSSLQLDTAGRGFSFQQDGPLDMRMNATEGVTASEWLRLAPEMEITSALRDFGDVKPAGRIAKVLHRRARAGTLETTEDMREAIHEALPFVTGVPDEIRTVFQAVRIVVNHELDALREVLEDAPGLLLPEGRLVVISFHSGEDRLVKQAMRAHGRTRRILKADGRVERSIPPVLDILTPKPIRPDDEERRLNPRSACARLRAAVKLDTRRADHDIA